MEKNLVAALCARAVMSLAACAAATSFAQPAPVPAGQPLKVGFVYVTPIGDAGWTHQHDLGRLQMEKALGNRVKTTVVDNVPEGADSERVIRDLAGQGNQLIFTTSFGYMEPTLKVARQFPDVAFEHATGYKTAANVGIYNARFYEGRYLAGMVAGRMSKSHVAGYVAAFPIPEVLQGINAFAMGMRAVQPKSEVKVVWVNSWYDPGRERDAANTLMNQGADVLTHHTDSTAAVAAAEEKGRYSIGYHSDMSKFGPKGQLAAVTHHWGAYYTRQAGQVLAGNWKPGTVWAGIKDGFVDLEALNPVLPADLVKQVKARRDDIAAGRFHPFAGRIVDNDGKVRQEKGTMDDELLNRMDYYVAGVAGKLPRQ